MAALSKTPLTKKEVTLIMWGALVGIIITNLIWGIYFLDLLREVIPIEQVLPRVPLES